MSLGETLEALIFRLFSFVFFGWGGGGGGVEDILFCESMSLQLAFRYSVDLNPKPITTCLFSERFYFKMIDRTKISVSWLCRGVLRAINWPLVLVVFENKISIEWPLISHKNLVCKIIREENWFGMLGFTKGSLAIIRNMKYNLIMTFKKRFGWKYIPKLTQFKVCFTQNY